MATLMLGLVSCGGGGANLCADAAKSGQTNSASAPFTSIIPLGAAVRWDRVKDSPGYAAFFLSHYGWLTPENELKMDALEPERGHFEFSRADAMVRWALRHGKPVHGHVLVWSQQMPPWVASLRQKTITTKGTTAAREAMDTYIKTVVSHFTTGIHEWDVVNEAFKTNGAYVPSAWYRELGPAYIEDAYRAARTADPSARLCYNDLGIELPGPHAAAVLALVKRLRALGLLDCVGFELHTSIPGPPERELTQQLRMFAATGVDVLISELDVAAAPVAGSASTTARLAQAVAQARVYSDVAHACLAVSRCRRITTWGFTDASSWLGSAVAPLPFDAQCRAKPAWLGLRAALQRSDSRATR